MNKLTCEMCGSNDLIKEDGCFVCQGCGTKYSVEEAKRMMVEGTVDVKGTVKVDNTAFVEKYLQNARRALDKQDWEEVEKYYNLVEQNSPNNMEAVFFSSFGKAMLSMTDSEYYKRQQKFQVLIKSISVINDYYELTTENKEEVLRKIADNVASMYSLNYVYKQNAGYGMVGSYSWCKDLLNLVKTAFITELNQIKDKHDDVYIDELIQKMNAIKTGGCYIATAVYGTYDCPQVWTFRRFRDYNLAHKTTGRIFIKFYYAVSPKFIKIFGKTKWFNKLFKRRLDKFYNKLLLLGYSDVPYND